MARANSGEHTPDPRSRITQFVEERVRSAVAAKGAADPGCEVDFRYVLDDTNFPEASGHPRCIFGVRAGLRFDQGFQTLKDKNLVNWLDNSTLKPFQLKLIPHFHRFSTLPSLV